MSWTPDEPPDDEQDDSPDAEVFVIAGFNFRFGGPPGPDEEGPTAPASMFGR